MLRGGIWLGVCWVLLKPIVGSDNTLASYGFMTIAYGVFANIQPPSCIVHGVGV
jgi:hypothetical protein